MAYTLLFTADMGANNTGLTLNAQLYNADGTTNGAAIVAGFVEVDNVNAPGVYSYNHTALPDGHRGSFVVYNSADQTQRVPFAVNPQEAEYLDTAVGGLNDLSAAQVNTEVDNAIETYHLDHLLAANYDPASKPGTGTALLNELVENDGGVSRFTANALEQATGGATAAQVRAEIDANSTQLAAIVADTGTDGVVVAELKDSALADFFNVASGQTYASAIDESVVKEITDNSGGASLSESGIAEAVWDQTKDGHTDPDTFGGQAATDIDTILENTTNLRNDDVPSLIAALNDPTAGAIADAVWEEDTASHVSPTTFGGDVQGHTRLSELQSELTDLQTALTLAINNMNNLSTTQVKEAAGQALTEYDPATGSEVNILPSSIPDGVWSYSGVRSITYGTVQAESEGQAQITKYAGDTWDDVISNVSGLADRKDVYFVLKAKQDDEDDDALMLISENADLLRWRGAAVSDSTKASITLDESAETLSFTVERSVTRNAPQASYYLGIKVIYEERSVTVITGYFIVYSARVVTNEVSE